MRAPRFTRIVGIHLYTSAVAAIAALVLSATPASAATFVVTSCGQSSDGPAILGSDIDCTGVSAPGLTLGRNARVELNGFTISGGDGDGILCEGSCKVSSSKAEGGTIENFAGHGIVARSATFDNARVRVSKTIIRDNGGNGVLVDEVEGGFYGLKSEISGNSGAGVESPGRVTLGNMLVSNNGGDGVHGNRLKVFFSTIELNGWASGGTAVIADEFIKTDSADIVDNYGDGILVGESFRSVRMNVNRNAGTGIVFQQIGGAAFLFLSEISDNGLDGIRVDGSQTERLRLKYAFVRRNGRNGVSARFARVALSRVDENGFHGVVAEPGGEECKIRVSKFSVVDNGMDASCGVAQTCADIASCAAPLFVHPETDCDFSYDTTSGFPGTNWGVCKED